PENRPGGARSRVPQPPAHAGLVADAGRISLRDPAGQGYPEDIAGVQVVGYRAPNFSIGRAQAWAYAVLAEEGFRYDSSVYPILHDSYGDWRAPRFPHEIWRSGRECLIEFPIGTLRALGVNLP